MFPLVEIPDIVQHYAPFFASVFSPEALQQFQRYVSGLIVSENKTVDGINRLFVLDVRNQSSLNRLLTESPFSVGVLNQARLALLQRLPNTQMKPKGVLSVDDTLLTHYGQHFEKIAYLYDSTQQCYVWAHNLVNLHYSDDQTDYPVDCHLWEPADLDTLETGLRAASITIRQSKYGLKDTAPKKWRQYVLGLWRRHQHKPEVQKLFQSKLLLAQQMLSEFLATGGPHKLPVTFDNWYTQPAFCRFLDKTLKVPYVGTLASDDLVVVQQDQQRLEAFADHLKQEHHQAIKDGGRPVFRKLSITYKGDKETYYSYCKTHRIHNFGKHRLVINHRKADLSDTATYVISNKLNWQAGGITRIRRHRWPVEVYHEEGKADGLDQYQVRDFEAISRHIALVAVTYSLLRAAQHDEVLLHKLQRHVQTQLDGSAGSWRRNTQAQALWTLATCIATGLSQGQTLQDVMEPLIALFAY
jgi:DDE superfamily endonuclease